MNQLKPVEHITKIFNGEDLTIFNDGEPKFLLRDVCKILEIGHVSTVRKRLSEDVVYNHPLETRGGTQISTFINEDGLYDVILDSRKPEAKKFRKWITSKVIPSIRKHGAYATENTIENIINNPEFGIKLLTNLKEEQEKRKQAEQTIEEQKPKVMFADAVETSKSSILVGELAKVLKQNGVNIGQNRLFEWLRDNGFLIRQKGENWNLPTQRSMDMDLFEIKKRTFNNPDGSIHTKRTTKVTGKGQIYFVKKFLGDAS